MRDFLKLMVSILVIAVILYTIYFMLNNNAEYQQNKTNIENILNEEQLQKDTEKNQDKENETEINNNVDIENDETIKNEIKENEDSNLIDNSIEEKDVLEEKNEDFIQEMTSGDIEDKISKINLIETKNNLSNLTKSFEDNVNIDIMGIKNQDFFDSFDMSQMNVTIQVAGSMVYIIPMPDLVDNAQYHYDKNGNLALYVCELTGIGGEIRYYFDNEILLTKTTNVDEDIELSYEDVNEIIMRSKLIYNQYMK